MIRHAGFRPLLRGARCVVASGADVVEGNRDRQSATACGIPPPYLVEGMSSGSTSVSTSPTATITASWWPWYEPKILRIVSRPVSRAGDPDRVHRRFGAGVVEAPLRQAEAPRKLLGDLDPVLGRSGEVGAQSDALLDRLDDRRVRVALRHRAEPVVEVPELAAVDVPDDRALAALEIDRPRLSHLVRGRHASGQDCPRAARTSPSMRASPRRAACSRARSAP